METKEYSLKAAFIFNFTKYIDWSVTEARDEFIIGVIGNSPINAPLEEIAKSKTVKDKKITLRKFNNANEINFCNILFIGREAPVPLRDIFVKTGKGTLTVSEQAGYAKEGIAINFIIVNNNLKFEANTKTMEAAGLKVSSQLLKLAIVVE